MLNHQLSQRILRARLWELELRGLGGIYGKRCWRTSVTRFRGPARDPALSLAIPDPQTSNRSSGAQRPKQS